MQMPARHTILSQPFRMDQIIQTAFDTIASLCRTYVRSPKEHFCSRMLTLVGYFAKHATMREAFFFFFLGTGLQGPSRNLKSNNSCLFPSHQFWPESEHCTLQCGPEEQRSLCWKQSQEDAAWQSPQCRRQPTSYTAKTATTGDCLHTPGSRVSDARFGGSLCESEPNVEHFFFFFFFLERTMT